MPGCCALGCTNRSEHGYRMFLLPQGDRNEDRRLQWVKNIGRPDVPSKSVVCEKHFTPDQFENNRQDNKRLLKWNAIPTLFDYSVYTKVSRRKIMKDVFIKQERLSSGNLQDLAEDEIVISNIEDTNTINNSTKQCIEQSRKTSKIKDVRSVASRKSSRIINHITLSNVELPKENKTTVMTKQNIVFNKRAYNRRAKKKNSSKLEDFAEVISEEYLPKRSRVAILGHKKKPLVKKLVRVSTENICRLCGKLSDTLQPIFGDVARKKRVPFIINQHLPIQVSETDIGWPRNICEICIKNLIEWEVLYNKCKDVDVTFKKMLKQPSVSTSVSATAVSNKNAVAGVSCVDNANNSSSNVEVNKKVIVNHHTHDHNYCPTKQLHGSKESISSSDTKSILEVVENTNHKSVIPCTKLKNKSITNDRTSSLYFNDDKSLQINVDNNNTLFLNDKRSAAGKHEYKICVSMVKNKDANEDTELEFSSLKSILIDKVNQLFQSICTDKTIGKSLINTSDGTCDEHNNYSDCINGKRKLKNKVDITSSCSNDDNECDIKRNCMNQQKDSLIKPTFKSKIKHTSTSKLTGLMIKPRGNVTTARKNDDGPFLCSFCGHIAQKRRSFSQHRRVHHVEKKCNYCDLTLPSFFEYRRHIRLLHKDRISNNCCDLCGAKFIKKERLERHKLIIHNVGKYLFCDICNKKCASKQQLHCHKSDVHHKEKNLCQYCGQYFVSHNAFLSHLRQKHYKKNTHSCVICDKKFTNSSSFTLHLARHASEEKSDDDNKIASTLLDKKMNSCLICNVKIDDISMLQQHMSYHADDEDVKMLEGNDKGLFKCNFCDKHLDKEKDLALHRFYFHKEPPFACLLDDCNCTFWRRSALVVHQITSHKKFMHCCKICSESFSNIKDKQCHMKIHHPDPLKLFKCVQCEKQFSSLANLKIHMVVHSDIRKYKCHLCGKSFKLKLTLSRHLQFHKKNDIQHIDIKKSTFAELETNVVESFIICDAEQQLQESVENCSDIYKIGTVFKCPSCNLLFAHRDVLENHNAEVHNNEGELVNYELIDVVKLTMEDGSEFI